MGVLHCKFKKKNYSVLIFAVVFLVLSALRFDFYLNKKIETIISIPTFQILRFRTVNANNYNSLGLFEGT